MVFTRKCVAVLLALIFTYTLTFLAVPSPSADAAALRLGSKGDDVVKVQARLRDWGYYPGPVDGDYGAGTEAAVKYFQRKNGLYPDGIVGVMTAAKIGISLSSTATVARSSNPSSNDIYLLARLIYAESRGEPYAGLVAVGATVLNRVKNSQFPNTLAGVIYQPGAFSVVSDGQINYAPDATALQAARDAFNGWDPSGGALFYYNPAKTTNKWMLSLRVLVVIGNHRFCI